MCRRNHMYGFGLIAFGLGLLIGLCLESGFLCSCLGVGFVIAGIFCIQKK